MKFRVPISGQIIWVTEGDKKYPAAFVLGKWYKKYKKAHIAIYPFVWRERFRDPIVPMVKLYAEKEMIKCDSQKELKHIVNQYIRSKNIRCTVKSNVYRLLVVINKSIFGQCTLNVRFKTSENALCQIPDNNLDGLIIDPYNLYVYSKAIHNIFFIRHKLRYMVMDFDTYDDDQLWRFK